MGRRGYTKKEANRRRTRFMVLAGMGDFIGIDEVIILALEVCHVADDDICIRKEGIDIFKLDKLLCMIGLEDIISDHFCT